MFVRSALAITAIAASTASAGPVLAHEADLIAGTAHPARSAAWTTRSWFAGDLQDLAADKVNDEIRASAWDQLGNLADAGYTFFDMARVVHAPRARSMATTRARVYGQLGEIVKAALATPLIEVGTVIREHAPSDVVAPVARENEWPDLFHERATFDTSASDSISLLRF